MTTCLAKANGARLQATGISRAGRAAADARTWSARRWPLRRQFKAISPTFASGSTGNGPSALYGASWIGGAIAPQSCRHRSDHPEAIPEADRANRIRPVPLSRLEARAVVRAEPAAIRQRV